MGAALSVSRILDDFKWLVQDQHLAKIVSFYEELPMVGQERPVRSHSFRPTVTLRRRNLT